MIGPYEIQSVLGQGGMGVVYKALHTKLDKVVALKILAPHRLERPNVLARFQREMKAVGQLEHPHLVRALDAGEVDGVHFLAMEYLNGIDLSQLIKQQSVLPVADAADLIRQAALGLQVAHQRGMVHRDIKPANMMLVRQEFGPPVLKVLDLGLAWMEGRESEESGLTSEDCILGTIDYLAPEQAAGRKADTRVDVYGLGASLFALLSGRPPYQTAGQESILQKLHALANDPLPSLNDLRADVPEPLVAILEKMLAKNPEDRNAKPGEVAAALEPFTDGANLVPLLEAGDDATRSIKLSGSDSTWSVSPTDPTTAMPKSKHSAFRWGAALLVFVPLLVFFSGTILRFATNEGTLVIEVSDPDIEVKVLQEGAVVKQRTQDREFVLKAKAGKIEVYEKDSIFLTTKQFELRRGQQTTVRVTLEELQTARKPPRNDEANRFCLAFDGMDDYIEIPNLPDWQNQPLTFEATIQGDIKGPRLSALMELVGLKLRLFRPGYQWMLIAYGPGEQTEMVADPTPPLNKLLELQKPMHLAAVYDKKSLALFINGELRSKRPVPKTFRIEKLLKSGYVGTSGSLSPDSFFAGRIDEVRISKTARYTKTYKPTQRLTADEDTLALYHFDEGQGKVVKDESGNDHHGKIHGATWGKPFTTESKTPR